MRTYNLMPTILWFDLGATDPSFKEGREWSDSMVVFNGKEVVDDVYCRKVKTTRLGHEYKFEFWVHYFGYDNDSYELEGITHFAYLQTLMPQIQLEGFGEKGVRILNSLELRDFSIDRLVHFKKKICEILHKRGIDVEMIITSDPNELITFELKKHA